MSITSTRDHRSPVPAMASSAAAEEAAELLASRPTELSDADLADAVATVVGVPRAAAADSFLLHAPLEVLARRALLPHVDPARRTAARSRMVAVALRYHAVDAAAPVEVREHRSVAAGVQEVSRAVAAGDLEAIDASARWLAGVATPADLLGLADVVVPSLAAAGHGSILLELLPRAAPHSRAAMSLVRPIVREAGRHPDWALTWQRGVQLAGPRPHDRGPGDHIVAALLATPRTGRPGSDFIYPLMHHAEASGVAAEVVTSAIPAGAPRAEVGRSLARVASLSMLLDDVDATPYGWTHCLTIPQAIVAVASATSSPEEAVAVAATHVVGFRTALSIRDVEPRYAPVAPGVGAIEALDVGPEVAAAAVHHARSAEIPAIRSELVSFAAAHEDAHLAKCTLALLDAAAADPPAERLHLSAAAHLSAWWRHHDRA